MVTSCSIQYVRNVLGQIKELSSFLNFSEPCQKKLDNPTENHALVCLKKKLKNICRTRWIEQIIGRTILGIFIFQLYFA